MDDEYREAAEARDRNVPDELFPGDEDDDEGARDPMDEFPFVVIHPTTGDRAYADDRGGAELAQRTLRNEATDAGCNPRTRPAIIHINRGRAA